MTQDSQAAPTPVQLVLALARAQGFDLAGVAPAQPSARAEYVRAWLGAGRHGSMEYLARHVATRLDPRRLVPGARSVICVATRYAADAPAPAPPAGAAGRIARYARGRDYHVTLKRRLHALADELRRRWPGHEHRCCVDTAPLLEREVAAAAGLGWLGKNTLLLHPRQGSYLLLGEIVTTLDLPATRAGTAPADHCGTCRRCIDACPTRCIDPDGYRMDASRCISYFTIEHRGAVDPGAFAALGDWIAGCDVCQEVCPYNRSCGDGPVAPEGAEPEAAGSRLPLLEVLGWTAADRRQALRGSALKRIKLDMFKRNALIAAGNWLAAHDDPALRRRVEALADDGAEPDLVRRTAAAVLERLPPGPPPGPRAPLAHPA